MLIIDGDYPLACGAVDWNRDLTLPIDQVRSAEPATQKSGVWPDDQTMASLPEMRRGRIAAALMKMCARISRPGSPLWGHRSGELSYAAAQAQLAYYRVLDDTDQVRILKTKQDMARHMRSWSEASDFDDMPVGAVLGLEGADPILWPEQVHQWADSGTRVVSLTHYGVGTYAHGTGTGTDGELFPLAEPLLVEMEKAGMILDVTHASDESMRQALDIFGGPVLASHHNCRSLVPGERQLPDELLGRIIDRGAVIGTSMDTWMLYKPGLDWGGDFPSRRSVFRREAVTLEHVADHIDHVCQLAGDALHAAIGGDTDGQGGTDGAPLEIDTVADYQKLVGVLERRGYATEDIENIMHGNWQRFFETWLPDET